MGGQAQAGRAWRFFLGWSIVKWLWVFWSWQMFDADIFPGGVPALPLLGHRQRTLFLQLFLPISLCWWIYLLYIDSLSWSSIILPGLLGQKSKQFQANSRNLEYIWSTGKKTCMAFALTNSGCRAYPTPALSWLSQHILAFFGTSQTLVHCVPKTKIKVSQWFHWCSLSIMWQTSPHFLQRKHFRRLFSLEKTLLNLISSPFLYPQCEWKASIRTFFSFRFAGFCFLEPRSNFQFHILIDIPWYSWDMYVTERWNRLIRWNCISPV